MNPIIIPTETGTTYVVTCTETAPQMFLITTTRKAAGAMDILIDSEMVSGSRTFAEVVATTTAADWAELVGITAA